MLALVTRVSNWSMQDEHGKDMNGETVEYFNLEYCEETTKARGMQSFKSGKPAHVDFPSVPGFYDFEMVPKRNQKGKLELTLGGSRFLGPCDLMTAAKAATLKKTA